MLVWYAPTKNQKQTILEAKTMSSIHDNVYIQRQDDAAKVLACVCDSLMSDSFEEIKTPRNGWLVARILYPEYQISLVDKDNDSLDLMIIHRLSGSQYLFPLDYDMSRGRSLGYCVKKFLKIALASFGSQI